MHKKSGIRALALVLALVMVLGFMPAASAAPAQLETDRFKTIAEYLDEQKTVFDRVDPDTRVEFIVELEDAPLADSIPAGMKLADYLNTRKGSVQVSAIEQQQSVMAAAIEKCAEDLAVIHRYQVVMNGFAVSGRLSDREKLEALEGVKRVTLGNTYSVPELQEAEGEMVTSGELLNSDAANAEGFTGKGTFAAVLDTGLKVDHEAFIGEKVEGALVTAESIAALSGLTASGRLYHNAKIAFAYDYADEDDDVSDTEGHGTHVAGTVAANGESFRGVAPDAQLAIMKVFGDEGGALDSDIIAALEDCVILGVDTVNMSLGTPCGFTFENEATDAVYNTVRNAGVNLMISAGNDYNSAFQNLHGTDLALAGNPDYGIVGSPSTYAAALSVASVNENLAFGSYLLLGEEKITFDETPDAALKIGDLEGTYEYVRVSGVGNANDFAKVDVAGKIALVERGEIAFTEKEQNAYDAGAIAMLVYNNSDAEETVYMQLSGLIPAVFLSKAEGKLLRNAAVKEVTVSAAFSGRMENPVAGQMSDFSSMGVAPDLSLKPEITAPGGNVWSASISGGYEEMSGTSMAAPHMTGAAALVRQYVSETYPELSDFDKQELVDNLLMSTAVPVVAPNGVAYTPRKQGAGLANVSAAIHAGAYLTVDGGRPKAELGESGEGAYSFTFTVHNLSDTAKTWNVSLDPITAQTETLYGQDYISELCRAMEADELTVTFSAETVTVQPGQTADVTVTLALTESGKANLAVFPNGIYVEGFVRLTGDDAAALGLPYLGFYGDWADAPIFDSTVYDQEASFIAESAMVQMDYNGNGNYLGTNAITGNARAEWISYGSRNAGYNLITPMQGLLRAPKEIWYTAVSDADPENPVYVMAYENNFKSFYYSSGGYIYTDFVNWEDSWQPIGGSDEEGWYYLEDGPYTYRIEARIDGQEEYQKSEYPIFIDNEAPSIVDHTYEVVDGKPTLTVRVTDNHYVMAAQLVDEDFTKALSDIIAVEETELGAITTLTFDLTDVQEDGYKMCRLDIYDYAWNEHLSDLMSTTSQDVEPQIVQINEYAVTANVDSSNMEMHALVDPDNAVNKTLVWSSTNEAVAKVVAVSGDTLTAEIDFVGPGECEIRATAVNGVYGAASVTVTAPTTTWPSDNTIRQDGYYTIPANLNTTVTITDSAHNVRLTGAAENTQDNPYQNLAIDSLNSELNLTIEDLHLSNGANYSSANGIDFTGTGNTLTLAGENSVTLADYGSYAAIHVPDGVELTVDGSGKLTILGNHNNYGAGIGSNAGEDAGKIVINGGTFVIDKVFAGAAIGTGSGNAKCSIIINGGSFDIAMPNAESGYTNNLAYCGAAIGTGNAATGGWSTPYKTMKITINGGDFTGYTNVDSPIIGVANGSGNLNAVIDINGGKFDLLTEDKVDNTMTGGACIGTGVQGYYGALVPDITITGGEIVAVSKSNGAAIGGGPGQDGGNLYIFGGTITAISEFEADAIGAGTASPKSSNNVRISGGSVKAVSTGTGMAFRDTSLLNDDSDAVFLVNIEAPDVTSVTVNGVDWHISANHPGDDNLYLYLPSIEGAHGVQIGDEQYIVTVFENGEVIVYHVVPADTSALEAAVADAEALNPDDYTPFTWSVVVDALEYAYMILDMELPPQSEVDYALENLNAAIAALVLRADTTALTSAINTAKELTAENYTTSSWAGLETAIFWAEELLLDPNATQEEINAVLDDLNNAIAALVDISNLKVAIAEAEKYDMEDYSYSTWLALQDAIIAAQTIILEGRATQEEVDAALEALNVAIAGLAPQVDTTALAKAYEALAAIELGDYTIDSWNESNLSGCNARAYAVLFEGYYMTQEEVDQLTADIWAGIEKLVKRGDLTELAALYEAVTLDWERLAGNVFPEDVRNEFLNGYYPAGGFLSDEIAAKNYSQADVDAMYEKLLAAWNLLKEYPVNTMYADMPAGEWYYDAVDFVTRYGFMNGMDDGTFNASGNVNRAQFVTILYRIAGQPEVTIANPFKDVPAGQWYTDAVLWAYEQGITTGTDATHFNPAGTLMRQNMVTFLLRFANTMGVDTTARADLSGYTDADLILPHAQDAMAWAVAEGIISGMSATTLAPNGLANRAQIATIISRFVPKYLW